MGGVTTQHTSCIIKRPMNSYGALILSQVTGSRTYQVVNYNRPEVKETLSTVDRGSTVRVWLEPINSRGDAWKVVDIHDKIDITDNILLKIHG